MDVLAKYYDHFSEDELWAFTRTVNRLVDQFYKLIEKFDAVVDEIQNDMNNFLSLKVGIFILHYVG